MCHLEFRRWLGPLSCLLSALLSSALLAETTRFVRFEHLDNTAYGRLDGEVVREQRTSDLLFDSAAIVSFISRYVTLEPGDVIFTGTPGRTRAMAPGDVIEVELEGVGVLSNPVVSEAPRP